MYLGRVKNGKKWKITKPRVAWPHGLNTSIRFQNDAESPEI